MLRNLQIRALTPFAFLLMAAADPSWKAKPVSEWSAEDARQLLSDSPWVKKTKVAVIPGRSEDQLREGGQMGGAARERERAAGGSINREVTVRWESALPVRTAEFIAHEIGAPDWSGDYYVIAVYDVPGLAAANPKASAAGLRRSAFLRRDHQKDLTPSAVDVVTMANKLARVVYLFPRSPAISPEDARIEFTAQIGRLSMTQYFRTEEMQLRGKLEL